MYCQGGFTLDMGGKCPYQGEGQMPKDKSPNPLFNCESRQLYTAALAHHPSETPCAAGC